MHVHLSLGSNLGDRMANLRAAVAALKEMDAIQVTAVSNCYETDPVGKVAQPSFLNLAVEIETDLEPLELLDTLQELERRLGREPSGRWGSRSIDLDIELWGARQVASERLTIPHQEFRRRAFVLAPLAEIAPGAVDPLSGKTVAELAQSPDAVGRVVQIGPLDH